MFTAHIAISRDDASDDLVVRLIRFVVNGMLTPIQDMEVRMLIRRGLVGPTFVAFAFYQKRGSFKGALLTP